MLKTCSNFTIEIRSHSIIRLHCFSFLSCIHDFPFTSEKKIMVLRRIVDVAVYYNTTQSEHCCLGIVETWGGEGHRNVAKFRSILYHDGLGLNATFTS